MKLGKDFHLWNFALMILLRSLDRNKANDHDGISIRIIKLCASSISKPLHLVFRNCLETESFPRELKKANLIPVHKKNMINNNKQMITNYKSVLVLPICEKVIFNSSFVNTNNDNLRNSNQSRLRLGDLFVHQLISITHFNNSFQ